MHVSRDDTEDRHAARTTIHGDFAKVSPWDTVAPAVGEWETPTAKLKRRNMGK